MVGAEAINATGFVTAVPLGVVPPGTTVDALWLTIGVVPPGTTEEGKNTDSPGAKMDAIVTKAIAKVPWGFARGVFPGVPPGDFFPDLGDCPLVFAGVA